MDQGKKSLFQRIRNAKQSLENAEKSFQDDKGMRGELDLMLAEAELKNLRNKQDVPWSWNRHLLALSLACLLVVSGLGGWFFAKGNEQQVQPVPVIQAETKVPQQPQEQAQVMPQQPVPNHNVSHASVPSTKQKINSVPEEPPATPIHKVELSEQEKRRLVRSAKTELSSGK